MAEADFWTDYMELVHAFYRPLSRKTSVPEKEIAAAEARLNIRLPGVLREFYLRAGAHKEVNRSHNRLIAPNELEMQNGKLVFYEENQRVVLWGIDVERK